MRLAVIGDVAGHRQELVDELVRLGMDDRHHALPPDLIVCQVGDLIHRGPDSPGVLELVDTLMRCNPGRWIQLAGNHEAQYLFDEPLFDFPEVLPRAYQRLLLKWWRKGQMNLAASFVTDGLVKIRPQGHSERIGSGELLVTHAGLTSGAWRLLGRPQTVRETQLAINAHKYDVSSPVWRSGAMLGRHLDRSAGCVWAEATDELYASWADQEHYPGFNQVHGHTSAMLWDQNHLREVPIPGVRLSVDYARRYVTAEAGPSVLWGIDPGHGRRPVKTWRSLEFDDAHRV